MKYTQCILAFVLVLFASAMCFAQDQVKLNPEQTRIVEKGDENGEWYETTEVMGSDGKYHEVGRKNLNAQAESKTAPKPDVASQKPEAKPIQAEPVIVPTTTEPSVVTSNNTVEPTEDVPTMTNADVPTATPVVSTPVIIVGETSTPKQTKEIKETEPAISHSASPVVSTPDSSGEILSEIRELSSSISAIGQEINEAVIRNSKQAEIISRQIAIENNQAEIRNAQDQILQQLDKRKQTTYRSNPFYLATSFIYGLLLGICLALLTVLYMLGELGSLFKRKKKDEKKEDDDDDDEDIGEPDLQALDGIEVDSDDEVTRPRGEFDHYYEVANPDDYPEVDPEKVETAATAQEVNDDSTAVTLTDATGTTDYNKKLFELKIHEPALQMILLIVLGGSIEAAKQLYGCLISILVRDVPPAELYGLKKIYAGFPMGSHASEDGTEVYFAEGTTSAEMAVGLEEARKQRMKFAEQNKPKAPDHMRPSDIGNPGL